MMVAFRLVFVLAMLEVVRVQAAVAKSDAHIHQAPYGPTADGDAEPRVHQHQNQPPARPNLHQPPPPPDLTPARPVINRVPTNPASGANTLSHFPTQLGLLSDVEPRKVVDTQVRCLKTHMQIQFSFSAPFNGYIYPHNHFTKCLLFRGQNSRQATMDMKHGTCGDEERTIELRDRTYLNPLIEHRLMIQWEPDIVCEDDVSVIVRCDRPDDFNKTVEWSFETKHLLSTLEQSQHPGPKMWMEIQRGEGPSAPSLDNQPVHIGDVLTLLFTLSDEVYWFDSNILACFAVDGQEQISQVEWDTSNNQLAQQTSRTFSGEMTVIEADCSVKAKIFSHFVKERHTRTTGELVTLHYAFFKAFRFPTSTKVVLQCHVQVCYKTCPEQPPCSEVFHPRRSEEARKRRRRAVEEAAEAGAHEVDQINLFRSLEVVSPEESGEKRVTVASQSEDPRDCCAQVAASATSSTVSTVMVVLLVVMLLLVLSLAILLIRDKRAHAQQKK